MSDQPVPDRPGTRIVNCYLNFGNRSADWMNFPYESEWRKMFAFFDNASDAELLDYDNLGRGTLQQIRLWCEKARIATLGTVAPEETILALRRTNERLVKAMRAAATILLESIK